MKGYNGWKNRATWNVAMWINNDYQWYECARGFMVDYTGVEAYVDFVACLRVCKSLGGSFLLYQKVYQVGLT